ncbi:MAG: endonuclease domain-containing protein [Bacteroidales bacterium]
MKKNPVLDREFFYGTTPEICRRASQLRTNMTDAEKTLWNKLRAKKTGFTFRRQHPINMYIADFYCHQAKLAVEIDGSVHEIDRLISYDQGRDDVFMKLGIKTLRFSNSELSYHINDVLEQIINQCIIRTKD